MLPVLVSDSWAARTRISLGWEFLSNPFSFLLSPFDTPIRQVRKAVAEATAVADRQVAATTAEASRKTSAASSEADRRVAAATEALARAEDERAAALEEVRRATEGRSVLSIPLAISASWQRGCGPPG